MSFAASPEVMTMLLSMQTVLQAIQTQLNAVHTELRTKPAGPLGARISYNVEEVAGILFRHPYTVREWCREGRIYAKKRTERRGGSELWSIAAEEVTRIKNEGLLPPDMSRNRG